MALDMTPGIRAARRISRLAAHCVVAALRMVKCSSACRAGGRTHLKSFSSRMMAGSGSRFCISVAHHSLKLSVFLLIGRNIPKCKGIIKAPGLQSSLGCVVMLNLLRDARMITSLVMSVDRAVYDG